MILQARETEFSKKMEGTAKVIEHLRIGSWVGVVECGYGRGLGKGRKSSGRRGGTLKNI